MSEDQPLSDNLAVYQQAIQEEYELAHSGTSDELASVAQERLFQLLPEASERLLAILCNGDKDDAVPFQAIKFIFEYTLGKPAIALTKENDVDKIIKQLMAPIE